MLFSANGREASLNHHVQYNKHSAMADEPFEYLSLAFHSVCEGTLDA